MLTYFVVSYWQLFVLRALTGISIGGCLPLVFNLLGDLFAAQHRASVLSGVLIATGAGTALGQTLAGLVGRALVPCWPSSNSFGLTASYHIHHDENGFRYM